MTVTCPKGHQSSEPDFCSECGAKIGLASTNGHAPNTPAPVGADACPDCGTHQAVDGGAFCELCGYNFQTGAHGEIPVPSQQAGKPVPKWMVVVTVDPTLKEPESPDPPADWTPLSIPADRDTLLIGRTSQARTAAPDIALDFDLAVSHRHALLTRANGSGWTIRDIGSSNGTRVNGQDLQAMIDVPLNAGDRITLGHWTCLTLAQENQP